MKKKEDRSPSYSEEDEYEDDFIDDDFIDGNGRNGEAFQ